MDDKIRTLEQECNIKNFKIKQIELDHKKQIEEKNKLIEILQ